MNNIQLREKTVLITGSAGFIGAALTRALLKKFSPIMVVGIDNMNDYYDVSIKEWRLKELEKEAAAYPGSVYRFVKGDIADCSTVENILIHII